MSLTKEQKLEILDISGKTLKVTTDCVLTLLKSVQSEVLVTETLNQLKFLKEVLSNKMDSIIFVVESLQND